MPGRSSEGTREGLEYDEESNIDLEALALTPRLADRSSQGYLRKSQAQEREHDHSHDHDHDHDRHGDHKHNCDHGHDHNGDYADHDAHAHDCDSCGHGDGWGKYLPHAHGLEHRLAVDRQSLMRAGAILLLAVLGQFIAGLISNSSVLIVEAIHSMLDGMNVLLALISVHLASRKPNSRLSYGYARAEVLSALVSVLGLGLLCFKLTVGALERLWHYFNGTRAKIHVEGRVVFIAEAVTLVANVAMTYVLSRNQSSLNIRALRAHVIADCVENVIVLFAGLLMWALPKASIIDPILTLCIVGLLVTVNAKIAWEAISILMQAAPNSADVKGAAFELRRVPGVAALGPLHVWTLTSGTVVATAVAKLDSKVERSRKSIREAFDHILKTYGATVTVVEMDEEEKEDMEMKPSEMERSDVEIRYSRSAQGD